MSRGLNKVQIIGNLGKDPEMKYTAQGTAVTTFSVAVTRSTKPQGSDQPVENTEWFRVVTWEKLAETCSEYLHKGSKVYIEGRLQTRKWTTQDGQERQMVEIVAQEMLMLDNKSDGSGNGSSNGFTGVQDLPGVTTASQLAGAVGSTGRTVLADVEPVEDIDF